MVLDVGSAELAHIKSQLEMSFLGERNLYWLGDLSKLAPKSYACWISYLSSYRGPHVVVFFTTKSVKSQDIALILLPDKVDFQSYKQLVPLLLERDAQCGLQAIKRVLHSAELVFKSVRVMRLDQSVRITDYMNVVGSSRNLFMQLWLESIIKPESSLFTLSGALLAGDKKGFLNQWKRLRGEYEFPFWMAYFSEQIFRAYCYVRYKKENKHFEAKKIGFRLPFSFIQRDWRRCDLDKLSVAHQRVYDLDIQLKTGGSLLTLDSLLSSFL